MERREAARDQGVHLREYWRVLWRGRYTVLAAFTVIVTVGLIATFLQTPVYRATATVKIQARAANVAPVKDISQIGTTDYGWSAEVRYFMTELEVLQSRDVGARAFGRLGLKDHPRFRDMQDPVGVFAGMLEIEPVDETNIVRLHVESRDREEAAAWVNALADAYVQRNLDEAREKTRAAVDDLLQGLEQRRRALEEMQQEKFKYAREQKVFVPEVQKRSYDERLSQLEKDYTTTQLHRLQLEAVFERIEEIDSTGGNYQVIPQVAEDAVLRDLNAKRIELETEHKRLLVSYKPGHFKVKEIASELEKLGQKIDAETDRIISAIRTDYSLTLEREKDLERAIEATKTEALDVTERVTAYTMLETEAEESKRIYDLMTARIKEIDVSGSLMQNNISVIDRAEVPRFPVRPKKILNLALSIILGLGLGVGLVFFLEYLDSTVRSAAMVERDLGLKMLAVIPKTRRETAAATNEAFHMLRLAVQLLAQEGERRVILVTSATPEEGKSTIAAALARSLARGGERVCLVDADLRRPALHSIFSIPSAPGVCNQVSDGENPAAYRGALRPGDVDGLSLLPCGPLPPNPPEVIATERFSTLVGALRAEFDWVVMDSAPVVGLADGPLLASLSDIVILVIRHAFTERDLVKRAVDDIGRVKEGIAGAVLNDVDITRGDARSSYGAVFYPVPPAKEADTAASLRRPAIL